MFSKGQFGVENVEKFFGYADRVTLYQISTNGFSHSKTKNMKKKNLTVSSKALELIKLNHPEGFFRPLYLWPYVDLFRGRPLGRI